MKPYRVIRKVKGNYYEYMQISWREGTQVKTKTVEYIGRYHGTPRSKKRKSTPKPSDTTGTSTLSGAVSAATKTTLKTPHPPGVIPWKDTRMRVSKAISKTGKIDEKKLYTTQLHLEARLKRKYNVNFTGNIALRSGKTFAVGKTKGGSKHTFYIPTKKGKVSAQRITHEVYRSQALLALRDIKKQDKEQYKTLKAQFCKAQRERNNALGRFWATTRSKSRQRNAVIVRRFGDPSAFNQLKGSAESYGLVEKRKFKNWKDEFASVYSELQKGSNKNGSTYTKKLSNEIVRSRKARKALSNPGVREWKSKKKKTTAMRKRKKIIGGHIRAPWKKAKYGSLKPKKPLGLRTVKNIEYTRSRTGRKMTRSNRRRAMKGVDRKQESLVQLYRSTKLVEKTLF